MTRDYSGWRFLYSPRWLGYYVMLLVFAVTCVLLSQWQFDRREEARVEMARLAANYEQVPVPLAELLTDPAQFDADTQKWRPALATGTYVGDPAVVRNRPGAVGTGSDLVQAFKTESGLIIFIDRGWIPETVTADNAFDFAGVPLAPTATPVTVELRLRASEPQVSGRSNTAESTGSINSADLAAVTGVDPAQVATASYGMLISETPEFTHGTLPAKPQLDEGPHLSYALQWVVFILIAGTGVGYAARQEFKNFNRGSAKVAAMEQKKRERRARRKPSDADEEDALLDASAAG